MTNRSFAPVVGALAAILLLTSAAGAAAKAKPKPRPDLAVVAANVKPASVAVGGTVSLELTIKNAGAAKASASDASVKLGTAVVGSVTVPALKPGKQVKRTATVKTASSLTAGVHKLVTCVDSKRKVAERKEGNNCLTAGLTLTASGSTSIAAAGATPPAPPAPPAPNPDPDGDGVVAGDCNNNDASIKPGAPDKPDLAYIDSNCDGIDGDAATAIFVSPLVGSDANPGSRSLPKATMAAAITAAAAGPVGTDVYVSGGSYPLLAGEEMPNGVGIYGHYDGTTWARPGVLETVLASPNGSGLVVDGATNVVLQDLRLRSGAGNTSGASSYALRAINGASVHLASVAIIAGNGAAASSSPQFPPAPRGVNGAAGIQSTCTGTGTVFSVSFTAGGRGGNGGAGAADVAGVTGGAGADGGGSGGRGGLAAGAAGQPGGLGDPGIPGLNGRAVELPTSNTTVWSSGAGGAGSVGSVGRPGGGGGGGAGNSAFVFPTFVYSSGATGGQGGGGGLGGLGGPGGLGGGGSFGIYAWNSTITTSQVSIVAGNGGAGGSGASGAFGGAGGAGGNGGVAAPCFRNATQYTGGAGGVGGSGGSGGAGGRGAGGNGGPSVGVRLGGTSTISGTHSTTLGSGGLGGAAGATGGGAAASGSAGFARAVVATH